jgi:biofilm PGA synthesis N-glycosyltransferase PgaC
VKGIFWLSIFVVVYAYLLYPCWLYLRTQLYPQPVDKKRIFPKVSIVIAVRNEALNLEEKLNNLQRLDYPGELLETIVVSDGSTDETNEILGKATSVHGILLPAQAGKAEALNRGIAVATGELLVFMDARQRVASDSIRMLAEGFADAAVGCVSGALVLGEGEESSPRGVGSYWKMEKSIRNWESESGSVVGATGALYAVRRSLVSRLPTGTILDDVFIPMEVARQRARVIFEPRAIAWDSLPPNPKQEFHRKVRTLFGNYQLLRVAPWLLTGENPLRFEFVSHKLVRLAVPFALIAMILSSALLPGLVYRLPLVAAIGIVALGALAYVRVPLGFVSRITDLALAFVLLNTAAIVAFFYFSVGKKQVWVP